MKKVFAVFAVVGLFFASSCGNAKVDQEASEIEIMEGEPEEILDDSMEIMEEDSSALPVDSVQVAH